MEMGGGPSAGRIKIKTIKYRELTRHRQLQQVTDRVSLDWTLH
jgi:hypothetical protein